MRITAFVFAIFFAAAPLASQSSLGSVEGKVVNAITGEAVKKAVVNIRNRAGQFTYVTTTDQSGKFHFDNVQPEKYSATADAEGFAAARTGRDVKLFTVAAGQQLTGVQIPIAPLSVITGKVLDGDDQPIDRATVLALRYVYNTGTKTLQVVSTAQTDDRGQYRIFDLQPGRYYLGASGPRQPIAPTQAQGASHIHSTVPEEAYATVIYPGVADVTQAAAYELKPGAEWTGADFKLHKMQAYHIRGHVNGPPLAGGRGGTVEGDLCDPQPMPARISLQPVMARPDGSFDITGAVPGTYCISVREPTRGGISGRQTVTVKDADVTGVTLTPETPFSVKGTLTIDGTPPANMPGFGVGLRASDGERQMHAQVKPDLSFQIDNILPGGQTIMAPSWPLLYVKSILYGGQDVSSGVIPNAQPGVVLQIVMGTDPGAIDGTVQLGSLESGAPVMLVALPDDAHAARTDMVRLASSSAEGVFTMQGLPPGDYRIFALDSPDFEDAQNRDLLKLLQGSATTVTVHAGGHEQASVIPVSEGDIEKAKEKLQ